MTYNKHYGNIKKLVIEWRKIHMSKTSILQFIKDNGRLPRKLSKKEALIQYIRDNGERPN